MYLGKKFQDQIIGKVKTEGQGRLREKIEKIRISLIQICKYFIVHDISNVISSRSHNFIVLRRVNCTLYNYIYFIKKCIMSYHAQFSKRHWLYMETFYCVLFNAVYCETTAKSCKC